jgi:hypothetical protein
MQSILRRAAPAGIAIAAGLFTAPAPAAAQDAGRIAAIEQQIKALQQELRRMKQDITRRDAAVKEAREEAVAGRRKAAQATAARPPGARHGRGHAATLAAAVLNTTPGTASRRRVPQRRPGHQAWRVHRGDRHIPVEERGGGRRLMLERYLAGQLAA